MIPSHNIENIKAIHTSLMKALIALNGNKPLTTEQLALFKAAIESKDTWDPNKANDLVKIQDIIALSPELLSAMGISAATLPAEIDWRQLSTLQRALLEQFDMKLEQIAKGLLAKAEHGVTPEDLKITGDSKWEQLARDLLVKTMQLVEEERGLKPGTLQNVKQTIS